MFVVEALAFAIAVLELEILNPVEPEFSAKRGDTEELTVDRQAVATGRVDDKGVAVAITVKGEICV